MIWEITSSVLGSTATITDGGTSDGFGQSRNAEKPFSVHPCSRFTVFAMSVPSVSASYHPERVFPRQVSRVFATGVMGRRFPEMRASGSRAELCLHPGRVPGRRYL